MKYGRVIAAAAVLVGAALMLQLGGRDAPAPVRGPPDVEAVPVAVPAAARAAEPARGAEQYRAEMTRSAWRNFGPDAPIAALAAQIDVESAWRADARSRAGAMGLSQFMPLTAQDMADRFPGECAPANPYSPRWAFTCRDRYMKSLLGQIKPFGFSMTEASHWAFALRAYNGGGVIKDRQAAARAGANPDSWVEVQPYNGRGRTAANFRENTEYPVKIFQRQARYLEWGPAIDGTVVR